MKTTPTYITELKENEIFVFGSNKNGHHLGGAAQQAFRQFGAVWNMGFGFQGQSFAIPTLDEKLEKLSIDELKVFVNQFIGLAKNNLNNNFLVTEIGCGIAGFKQEEIAPLFKECINAYNVYLPESFVKIINRTQIDDYLRQMNHISANIGIDSTPEEKRLAKQQIFDMTEEIKKIDPDYFEKIQQDEV